MTKNWSILEKIISGIQILCGVLMLILVIPFIEVYIEALNGMIDLSWDKISIYKIIWNHHYGVLLSIITLFAGITFLLSKKIGWSISIVTLFMHGIGAITICFNLTNSQYIIPPATASFQLVVS